MVPQIAWITINWCILIFELNCACSTWLLSWHLILNALKQTSQKNLTKYFNTLSFTVIFYRYPKTMLLKCFQNCMYSSRDKLEMNFTILHTVPCVTLKLFTISVKLKVSFQCCSETQWPDFDSSMAWFWYVWKEKLNKTDFFTKCFFLICWFFFYIYCNFAAAPNILSRQQIFLS